MNNIDKELLSYTEKKRLRVKFGEHDEKVKIPHLYDAQFKSYRKFINKTNISNSRLDFFLREFFPIYSNNKNIKLDYLGYKLGECIFTPLECKIKGLTYSATLRLGMHLSTIKEDPSDKKAIEQDVYILDMPLMTDTGTFIINGIERVVVSQLHKSPGLFFEIDRAKSSSLTNKILYTAKIIPQRGAWVDIEFDSKNCLFAKIDKKKKFPISILLKALGMTGQEILNTFLKKQEVYIDSKIIRVNLDYFETELNSFSEEPSSDNFVCIPISNLLNQIIAIDIVCDNTVIVESNTIVDDAVIDLLILKNIKKIYIIQTNNKDYREYISKTLKLDKTGNQAEAILEIHRILKPGEPANKESSKKTFENLFFSDKKYDLSIIGRIKLNERLETWLSDQTILFKDDFVDIVKKLINIKDEKDHIDDIDHLGNRRVRSIGEILENLFKSNFLKIEKAIREKVSLAEYEELGPQDMINTRNLATAVREFFCSSQLSQFMDQTNPLSEITHKRRLSALGPGGLTRERAGFEVRDVHNTHYGRICPIETPEGPNIGLINSLAIYARINIYGFLETPYILVLDKKLTNEVKYLSASEESDVVIAQANARFSIDSNLLLDEEIPCRFKNEFILTSPDKVQYMDISPKQIVSIATALIPFLEHDDANRALMGSNMQRQAVPLLKAEKPLVGTGMEKIVAMDSGITVRSRRGGVVERVDSARIIIKVNKSELKNDRVGVDIYNLLKYVRSNQNTCINQKPIVRVGDRIKKNDIIADGAATDFGELALGENLFVAFMSWHGFNFEDSIILSENVIKNNKLTSIHIEELICIARDLKSGPEDITVDIPGVNDYMIRNLDESGIIYLGADVKPGDILVGKVTKKTDAQLSPEERLLQAIFGEKASDVKDSSLRVPVGIKGTVIDVQIFNRSDLYKDKRTLEIEEMKIISSKKNFFDEFRILKNNLIDQIKTIVMNYNREYRSSLDLSSVLKMKITELKDLKLLDFSAKKDIYFKRLQIESLHKKYIKKIHEVEEKIKRGDDLPPGIIKIVKVSVAMRKKIQVGDKISGRHGNKGVVSNIIPIEDMPYLEDGTTIDVILNPLGVPSRMNIGQVLETHLGWAAKYLGLKLKYLSKNFDENLDIIKHFIESIYNIKNKNIDLSGFSHDEIRSLVLNLEDGIPFATPVFDGIKENEIKYLLNLAGLPSNGKIVLVDGRTGLQFDNETTVGYQYIMKLNHLIDDKMHARSTGTYSLVSQQPLGGKAQLGGQRFGEMEVWALEAYGAAYTLLEMLTVKSDDITGRTKIYKNIINSNQQMEIGIPEAFNVLTKEILALGLNIELEYE